MAFGNLKVQDLIYEDASNNEVTVVLASLAPKASPTFTGTVTVPTATAGDNTTKAASTAFVVASFAPKAAPTFTGVINGYDLVLSGNLTVNGTQTIINTQTLDVEDKQIEIGKVSSPSDTTANEGGIKLKGASDKTILWYDSTDAWTFSEHIHLLDSKQLKLGSDTDCYAWHDGSNAYIRNTTGSFLLEAKSGENAFVAIPDGAVKLYHNGLQRIETTSSGAKVAGTLETDVLNIYDSTTPWITVGYASNQSHRIQWDGAKLHLKADPSNNQNNSQIILNVDGSDKLILNKDGEFGIGGNNYGTTGQVLTSGGTGAAPTWTTPSAGADITSILKMTAL